MALIDFLSSLIGKRDLPMPIPERETWPGRQANFLSPLPTDKGTQDLNAVSSQNTGLQQQTVQPQQSPMQELIQARNPQVESLLGQNKSLENILQIINRVSAETGIPANLLQDIAFQESKFNPSAKNNQGTATGLFQFTAPTWSDAMRSYPQVNSMDDRLDPYLNALIAAKFISEGRLGRWDASKPVWGDFYNQEELSNYY